MYKIAICDDEPMEQNKIAELLEIYRQTCPNCSFTVDRFTSMAELLFEMEEQVQFDLLLLDIYMPQQTGIEGAKQLRKKGFEGHIIFLTTSNDHAIDAYSVDAVQYLTKPIDRERFFAVFHKLLAKVEKEHHRHLVLRAEGAVRRVAMRDLMYSESQNQYQHLHLKGGGGLRCRMTQAELFEHLCGVGDFVCVGRTYIVNLSYVDSITAKSLTLQDSELIWLPRGSYRALKRQYFDYYCKREEVI